MRKIYKESQLIELSKYSMEVIKCIKETISMIIENTGRCRG